MTSTELEARTGGALAVGAEQTAWTEQQLAVLRSAGVSQDVTQPELTAFLHECQRTGLDPFIRQIYLIGRKDKKAGREVYRAQTGIDGYRVIAHRAARRDSVALSYADTVWCGPDGKWRDAWLWEKPPLAAKITVFRDDRPFSAVATLGEYAARWPDGNLKDMWQRMPANQLAKCAEALALRKAFPHDLGGIYTAEEMEQADSHEHGGAPPQHQVAQAVERKARRERGAAPAGRYAVRPAEPTDAEEIAPQDEGLPSDEVEHQRRLAEQGREPWDDARPDRPSPTAGRGAPMSEPQMRKLQAMMKGWSSDEKHGVLAVILGRPVASAAELTVQDATVAIDALNKRRDDLIARVRGQAQVGGEPVQGEELLTELVRPIEAVTDVESLRALWDRAHAAQAAGMLSDQQFGTFDELCRARAQELAQPVGSVA
jgi:phage recombination protein Bet